MPLNAKDLPTDIKRQLLDQLRRQLGRDDYQMAVDHLGEDGLLDHALQSLQQAPHGGGRQRSKSSRSTGWGWSVLGTIAHVLFWVILAAFPALGVIIIVLMAIYWLYGWMYENMRAISLSPGHDPAGEAVVGTVVVLVLLGLFIAFCVFVVPWLWRGTVDWWGWLAGHF